MIESSDLAQSARLQHASRLPLLLSLQPSPVQLDSSQALMIATGLWAQKAPAMIAEKRVCLYIYSFIYSTRLSAMGKLVSFTT